MANSAVWDEPDRLGWKAFPPISFFLRPITLRGMPLAFAHVTGGTRYPPVFNPHYSGRLLLQPPLCCCDKPAHRLPMCRRAGSPFGWSTYCFKYASLPLDSARPSREASRRFRYEPS